jgi:PAS domain S-box-containing protein
MSSKPFFPRPITGFVRCQNAEEALLALVRGDFAAIVLDVQMPGTNGLELARLVKERRRSSTFPSSFSPPIFRMKRTCWRGYGAGAVDYLTKAVNPGILRSKVSVVVNLFQTTRALTAANIALRREIEQRQQAEQSLREANAALEARVQERTADLSRTNMELRRSEERYRLILENALEYAIFTLDLEGRVTSWNSGAQRVLGFDESEMIGQRLDVIFTAEDRDHGQVDIEMGRAVTNDRAQDERWHLRKDGSPFWATGPHDAAERRGRTTPGLSQDFTRPDPAQAGG